MISRAIRKAFTQVEPLPRGVRYDPDRGIYAYCRFCQGRGCISCPAEAKKAYEKEFPDGPQPIATFKVGSEPGAMDNLLRALIGPEAVSEAQEGAQQRAGEIITGDAGQFILGAVRSLTGQPVTAEAVRGHLADGMVSEVLAENIVAKAKAYEQADLFAPAALTAGGGDKARRKKSGKPGKKAGAKDDPK